MALNAHAEALVGKHLNLLSEMGTPSAAIPLIGHNLSNVFAASPYAGIAIPPSPGATMNTNAGSIVPNLSETIRQL